MANNGGKTEQLINTISEGEEGGVHRGERYSLYKIPLKAALARRIMGLMSSQGLCPIRDNVENPAIKAINAGKEQ